MMLGRQDDGIHAKDRAGFGVITQRHLRFGVRTQPRQAAIFTQFGLALHQTVGIVNRSRHQLRGFVAGIAKHQALVARALVQIEALAFGHTLRNIRRLLVISHQHGAGFVVEADVGMVVADALDGVARDLDVIDIGGGGDFTRQHHKAGIDQRFCGDAGVLVLGQNGIEDGIGNLVGHFVRMTFGHRFGSKEKIFHG